MTQMADNHGFIFCTSIQIMDTRGRLVKNIAVKEGSSSTHVEVNQLAAKMYMLSFKVLQGRITKPIVIY